MARTAFALLLAHSSISESSSLFHAKSSWTRRHTIYSQCRGAPLSIVFQPPLVHHDADLALPIASWKIRQPQRRSMWPECDASGVPNTSFRLLWQGNTSWLQACLVVSFSIISKNAFVQDFICDLCCVRMLLLLHLDAQAHKEQRQWWSRYLSHAHDDACRLKVEVIIPRCFRVARAMTSLIPLRFVVE